MLTEESDTSGTVSGVESAPWHDAGRSPAERVQALLSRMSLEEKVAQLYAVWLGIDPDGDDVAPHQHELVDPDLDVRALIRSGIGQLTRPFGSAAVDATQGAQALARLQAEIVAANRWGIPAIVHEECLTGFMTAGATAFPTPLAWGATFDPEIVERMAAEIGGIMRSAGVHQGLAPVLDVVRDPRWGRTEESIGEDPYLVGTIGSAYVRGLEGAGVVATLKHFVGYSASRAARNLGPVSMGPRELADLLLPPFEMAVREGGARSIMHSYAAVDGVPAAADRHLLTDLLRDAWGFTGTVVADYNGVIFLELHHRVADSPGAAAALSLAAGVDVELPSVRCYGEPLVAAVRNGDVPEELVDRAARRVLEQKVQLGLLDPDWSPLPPALVEMPRADLDFDPPSSRELARTVAERSVVLVANDGPLPVEAGTRLAVIGPTAHDAAAMMGCYAFPNHVLTGTAPAAALRVPTLLDALRAEFGTELVEHVAGCDVDGTARTGFAAAVSAAEAADICVAVVGDRSGLFGRGTSGEGCDAAHLDLPGVQGELLEALLDTGTPVVLVVLSGRPYALGRYADRLAAIVQGFFPGAEGGSAVAAVLSGRVNPSGRLPVSVARHGYGTPSTYLEPVLGQQTRLSTVDPTPLFPFGHGLSYTSFGWSRPRVDCPAEGRLPTDGELSISVTVHNTGSRTGTDVVQLYVHDPVAQVVRPDMQLIGYRRVELQPGERVEVTFRVHADLTSFTGLAGTRIVEPGEIELRVCRSATDVQHTVSVTLTGPPRQVDHTRRLITDTIVRPAAGANEEGE